MNIGFSDFISFFFIPYVFNRYENNLLIYGRIEQGRKQVVIRKRVKRGFKTIVLDQDLLRIHYKNFLSNKKSRFNVIDYKLP